MIQANYWSQINKIEEESAQLRRKLKPKKDGMFWVFVILIIAVILSELL